MVPFKPLHRLLRSSLTLPHTQLSKHSARRSKGNPFLQLPQDSEQSWWLLEWVEAVGKGFVFSLE